jgi:hypothetical protein
MGQQHRDSAEQQRKGDRQPPETDNRLTTPGISCKEKQCSTHKPSSKSATCSTLTGGYRSTLILKFYDTPKNRYRIVTLEVGENGIEPNRPYKLDEKNKPTLAK